MAPDFNLWAGRPLPDWYYVIDPHLARLIGRLGDEDFARMLGTFDGAVMFRGEFDCYHRARLRLESEFRLAYADDAT